jgi:hypothetical protein
VVKVLELEGYEDSLNAIRFDVAPTLFEGDTRSAIGYVLDEAAGSGAATQAVRVDTLAFDAPFDYRLHTAVAPAGERGLAIDLAETACLMLGLAPTRIREAARKVGAGKGAKSARYRLIEGRLAQHDGECALLILREREDAPDAKAAQGEYEWVAARTREWFGKDLKDYPRVFHNRDMAFNGGENAVSLDGEVKRVMLERAEA